MKTLLTQSNAIVVIARANIFILFFWVAKIHKKHDGNK